MTSLLVLTLGLVFPASAGVQASQQGSVRGSVVDVTTNAPITAAEVALINLIHGISTTATTGRAWEFLFSAVEPGRYLLRPRGDGYVEVTEDVAGARSRSIVLRSGENLTDMTLRVGAGGVIAGTVLDLEREPVVDAPVSAFRYVYDAIRYRWTWMPAQHARTTDRGEFRIGGLHPGRYVVRATPPSNVELEDSFVGVAGTDAFRTLPLDVRTAITSEQGSGSNQRRDGHLPIYYPNTPDLRQAARIAIDFGRESYVQIVMPLEPAFSIRGAAIDPTSQGRLPTFFSLSSRTIRFPDSEDVAADGTFEFSNLAPGSYDINVILSTNESAGTVPSPIDGLPPLPVPVQPNTHPDRLVGHAEVTVINEDVEDIVIAPEAMTVSGRVEVPGGGMLPGGLFVAIRGLGLSSNQPHPAELHADGAFTITHVPQGDYLLIVTGLSGGMPNGLPAGWYVDSARFGAVDALAAGFRVDPVWAGQRLDIVLRQSSSRLSVTINEVARREGAVFVAAVPDAGRRHRPDLYRTGWTDERGFLSFDGIAPGQYRVFAWERIETNAWLDPEYIAGIESQGRLVRIGENGRESVEFRVIR